MKFKLTKNQNVSGEIQIKISLIPSGTRSSQLFWGHIERNLNFMNGHYDHKNKKLTDEPYSWEYNYVDKFINYCENDDFIGVYLLWFIAHLPIITPGIKTRENFGKNSSTLLELEENILGTGGGYAITIESQLTDCKDVDRIISEVSEALENFNIDIVFNEMIEHYKGLHAEAFKTKPNNPLLNFFLNIFSKKETGKIAPWQNKRLINQQNKSYKKALGVFKDHFEKNRAHFYKQLA